MSDNYRHIEAGVGWLCRAQDISRDGGVAGWFSFLKGWSPSYPETTGYIIPTFFDFCRKTGKEEYKKKAIRMADWLLSVQMENGAFPGHHIGIKPQPRVFNTGMAMLGLLRAFRETKNEKYLNAARGAGDFITLEQDADGAWRKYAFNDFAHTYYTRVAWALIELSKAANDVNYEAAARKNLDWALKQKRNNGWFDSCAFEAGKNPYTHTIAYMTEGLFESGISMNGKKYYEPAVDIAERLLKIYEIKKRIPGEFNSNWKGNFGYSCLTGDAQISIIWQKIYKFNNDARFLNAALKINDYLKERQNTRIPFKAMRGGVCGSGPVWGAYHPFWLPSWATKFFVDALLLEDEVMSNFV